MQVQKTRNRRLAFWFKLISTVFSVSITILLGAKIDEPYKTGFANTALFLGGLITVISVVDAFDNPRGVWVRDTQSYNQLNVIKTSLDYQLANDDHKISEDSLKDLYTAYDKALRDMNDNWLQMRGDEGGSAAH